MTNVAVYTMQKPGWTDFFELYVAKTNRVMLRAIEKKAARVHRG